MTNGDYIRQCTDEELAIKLFYFMCSIFRAYGIDYEDLDMEAEISDMVDFLKEEKIENLPS